MNKMKQDYVREDIEEASGCGLIDWERFRGKRIAVTGATGLLGKLLVRTLLRANERYNLDLRVLAFVRSAQKAERIFREVCAEHLEIAVQDVTQAPAADLRADFLIHTAAITVSKQMVTEPVETIMTQVEGTRQILEFALRCKMEGVVYLSSMEAYGIIPEGAGEVREKDLGFIDPREVRSSYSEGKRLCECLCVSYASEYGVPVKIARLAATSGPGIDPHDNRVIGQFARSVIHGENIVLHTKGEKANCYCYTADAVTAILFMLLNGEDAQVYNVCNPDTFCSIRQLAETFASLDESGKVKVVIDIPEDAGSLGYAPASVMKLNADLFLSLGWRPKTDLKEMASRITQSIRSELDG